ncbi:MAG: AbrB/MazE/SpoVT family DNA-binding domain-containing protein [Actinobacteria bacterium]|nr:AbrB/MazE/SpoVT family DNA-binding domain-containing protein [Actinomycetota bacterium]
MSRARTSVKGQIVIPSELRKKYNILPGSEVIITDGNGKILIFPLMKDPVKEARGILKGSTSLTEALLRERKVELNKEENGFYNNYELFKKD